MISCSEKGSVAGIYIHSKSYQVCEQGPGQAGVDTVNVFNFRTGIGEKMVLTRQTLSNCEQGPVTGWCEQV